MKRFSRLCLKVFGCFAMFAAIAAVIRPSAARASSVSNEGNAFIAAAYNYAFASRKLYFTTSLKGASGETRSSGFFVSDGKNGYLKIDNGVELYYTPELVTTYSRESNEMVLQPRKKKSKGDTSNPFSILDMDNKSVNVSLPRKEMSGAKELYYVVVAPLSKKGSAFTEARVYVTGWKGAGSKVAICRIVMTSRSGAVYETVIDSASSPDAALLERSVIAPSKYPDAKVIDLR